MTHVLSWTRHRLAWCYLWSSAAAHVTEAAPHPALDIPAWKPLMESRRWRYNGGNVFQSDRLLETISAALLQSLAAPGSELTYTVVPKGSETRIGIDRDEDGFYDRDELDACSNPADAAIIVRPQPPIQTRDSP